jgi:hypothetical protein
MQKSQFHRCKPLLSGRAAFAQAARSAGAALCATNSPLHPLVRGGTEWRTLARHDDGIHAIALAFRHLSGGCGAVMVNYRHS